MEANIAERLEPQLGEMTKFIKLGRGKIKNTVLETLYTHDNEQEKKFYRLKQVSQLIKDSYQKKHQKNLALSTELASSKEELILTQQHYEKENQALSTELASSKDELISTQQHYEIVITELKEAGLRYNLEGINELEEVAIRYNLVGDILSAPSPDNAGVHKFRTLLEQDFLDFANNDDSLAEEASALLKLQIIAV